MWESTGSSIVVVEAGSTTDRTSRTTSPSCASQLLLTLSLRTGTQRVSVCKDRGAMGDLAQQPGRTIKHEEESHECSISRLEAKSHSHGVVYVHGTGLDQGFA